MKTNPLVILTSGLFLICQSLFSQQLKSDSSQTKAFQCANNYIESFNNKNISKLENFTARYYISPNLNKKIESEKQLKNIWGKLTIIQVAYSSEDEVILLINASKMPNSNLVFDVKLSKSNKIDFFTRSGVNKQGVQSPSIEDIIRVADRSVPIDDSLVNQTVNKIATAYETYYFIPEIGNKISTTLHKNLESGKYNKLSKAGSLADEIKKDILEIHSDSHSWVEANRRLLPFDSIAGVSQNYGFEKAQILDNNIGYVKMNEFSPLKEAQVVAGKIFDSLANCKALILDLRTNSGGYPEMSQFLSSYFFQSPTKILTLYDRYGNIVNEIWTLEIIPGKRFNDSFPFYILTSNKTASAAEGFIDFFKQNKRATIIGETTNGARHPAKEISINPQFVISIPFLRGEKQELFQEKGIIPDVIVPENNALEKAIELAKK
jgi:hypothetical protein